MKQRFIKIILLTIFLFSVVFQQNYSKDSLLTNTDDYKLIYVGRDATLAELKSNFISNTTFVNIPIDSSFYKAEYPNPFSPSMVKQKFIYQLYDTSDITINIINHQDSILFNLKLENQVMGYYVFLIKSNYFMRPSLNKKLLSSFENIRIVFIIKDEEFKIRLSNLSY